MRLTVKHLRQLIKEELEDNFSRAEPFGKVLFGKQRLLPHGEPEPNTPIEDLFLRDLKQHYIHDSMALSSWVSTLLDMEEKGQYDDFLQVPKKYKHAYRILQEVEKDVAEKILKKKIPDDLEPEVVHQANSAIHEPWHEEMLVSSWTVDPKSLKKMWGNWGGWAESDFLILLRAPIHTGNRFLLNPDETRHMFPGFDYEREVLGMGTIECDHAWYITKKDPDSEPSTAPKLIKHFEDQGKDKS